MKSFTKISCALSIIAVLGCSVAPAMAMQPGTTVRAGFSGLPLRFCQGMYAAELKKLPIGQQLKVLSYDVIEGWSHVEVVGTGETGYVSNQNVY